MIITHKMLKSLTQLCINPVLRQENNTTTNTQLPRGRVVEINRRKRRRWQSSQVGSWSSQPSSPVSLDCFSALEAGPMSPCFFYPHYYQKCLYFVWKQQVPLTSLPNWLSSLSCTALVNMTHSTVTILLRGDVWHYGGCDYLLACWATWLDIWHRVYSHSTFCFLCVCDLECDAPGKRTEKQMAMEDESIAFFAGLPVFRKTCVYPPISV